MNTSLNYLVAQERSAELRRAAEAARRAEHLMTPGESRHGNSRIRSTLATLWSWGTRTRSSTAGEPEAPRAHA